MQVKWKLRIRVSSEPNRLAEIGLSNAYEKLIPMIKHPINTREKEIKNNIDMERPLRMRGNLKW